MMKEKTTTSDLMPNSCVPIRGTIVLSSPTIPPTKALMTTSSVNCCQFSRMPRRMEATSLSALGNGTTVRPRFERCRFILRQCARLVQFHNPEIVWRGRWYSIENRSDEILFAPEPGCDFGGYSAEMFADQFLVESRRFRSMTRQHERIDRKRKEPL